MKYIVIRRRFNTVTQDLPIIFPDDLLHADVAAAIKSLVDTLPVPPNATTEGVTSAGFIKFDTTPVTFGMSAGLGIAAKADDGALVMNHDFTNGIKRP